MASGAAPILGTLDCTDTASTVTLGNAGDNTLGTICFQITGTNGGSISVVARGTLMDPDDSPTWAEGLGLVNRTAQGTVIAALTGNGAYKIEAEGYSRVELKVDVAGTGSMVVRGRPVRG